MLAEEGFGGSGGEASSSTFGNLKDSTGSCGTSSVSIETAGASGTFWFSTGTKSFSGVFGASTDFLGSSGTSRRLV